jgi:hypothetical protein
MMRALAAGALTILAVAPAAASPSAHVTDVVVVKRAGVTAYEEVLEEFRERCRVRARVVSFGDEGVSVEQAHITSSDVVVTVGQEAFDAMRGAGGRIIPTLAFHTPPGLVGPPAGPGGV